MVSNSLLPTVPMFSSGVNEENSLSIPFLVITPDVSIDFFGSSESEPNSGWDGVTKGGRTGIMTCPTLRAQFNLWESGAFSVVEIVICLTFMSDQYI